MGAAGYAGVELARILMAHPDMDLVAITSDSDEGRMLRDVYPAFAGLTDLAFTSHDSLSGLDLDAVFLALPHTASMARVPAFLDAGVTVFDLSADFRLPSADVYREWYGVEHACPDLLERAVYGLPELFSRDLARARDRVSSGRAALVACPGCYPTATTLAAWPLVHAGLVSGTVVVDAISGVTGAGKRPSARTHFCSADEDVEAYGVGTHRHTPEIERNLSRADGHDHPVVFTPHLAPLSRGLLSTVTMSLASAIAADELAGLYRDAYADSAFVTVVEGQPRTASVVGTNRAQVAAVSVPRTSCVVATCAIDNLGKGAAGQAVQCANAVFGLGERRGLDLAPRAV
ncbi:MAG: N-acetyl-gamma-glutamyl-phosphate reductase [Atopobiaceae bacterium]|jgi:N-acetyl-gamma-glutamyl-phosphate reductase|nr:N-acetyl-gamma-glutamyl-phosphate reductase [Atopobiaceae bacterium]